LSFMGVGQTAALPVMSSGPFSSPAFYQARHAGAPAGLAGGRCRRQLAPD
jgi:hypothetical protein